MELRKSDRLVRQCSGIGGDPKQMLDYIVDLEKEKLDLLSTAGALDFSALRERMRSLEDDISRLRERSSIQHSHVVDAAPDATDVFDQPISADQHLQQQVEQVDSTPAVYDLLSLMRKASVDRGAKKDGTGSSSKAPVETTRSVRAASAASSGTVTKVHRPRLSAGSVPLYTLPESFRYDLSLRDTKEKSLTLAVPDGNAAPAAGGDIISKCEQGGYSPNLNGSMRRHQDISSITSRIGSSAAAPASMRHQNTAQRLLNARFTLNADSGSTDEHAASVLRSGTSGADDNCKTENSNDHVFRDKAMTMQERKLALRSVIQGKAPLAPRHGTERNRTSHSEFAIAGINESSPPKLQPASESAAAVSAEMNLIDEFDGIDLDKYLQQVDREQVDNIDRASGSISDHDSTKLLEASGSFRAADVADAEIEVLDDEDVESSSQSSAGGSSVMNEMEFCIVEADWSHLQSVTDRLTPLLPPRRTWKYPSDTTHLLRRSSSSSASSQPANSPSGSSATGKHTNSLDLQDQNFLFPSGVKVDLVWPSVAALQTRKRWQMRHIVPFTDALGRPAYACVLTVYQAYEMRDIAPLGDLIVPSLVKMKRLKFAANCIQKCYRQYVAYQRKKRWASPPIPPKAATSSTTSSLTGSNHAANNINNHKTRFSFFGGGSSTPSERTSKEADNLNKGTKHSAKASSQEILEVQTPKQTREGDDSDGGEGTAAVYALYAHSKSANNLKSDSTKREKESSSSLSETPPRPKSVEAGAPSRRLFSSLFGMGRSVEAGNNPDTGSTLPVNTLDNADNNSEKNSVASVGGATDESAQTPRSGDPAGDMDSASQNSRKGSKVNMLDYVSRCVVVAQKAYCITTTSQEYTFIFKVLDAIADAESRLGFVARQPVVGTVQKIEKNTFLPENYKSTDAVARRMLLSGHAHGNGKVALGTTAGGMANRSRLGNYQLIVMRECFLEQIETIMAEGIRLGNDLRQDKGKLIRSMTSQPNSSGLFQQQNVISSPARSRSHSAGSLTNSSRAVRLTQRGSLATARSDGLDSGARKDTTNNLSTAAMCIDEDQRRTKCISVPLYIEEFKFNPKLLLSTKEWSFSVMFTHLNSQVIFKIINLLLMEKSIIIHGKNAGIVTCITLAVVNLIHPFVWEGIFVPLVPDNARELFGAPVPLIVGTTSPPSIQDVAPSTAVLYLNDDNVNETRILASNRATISFTAWFVRLPDVSADLPVDEELCRRMDHVRLELCQYCCSRLEYCEETTEQLIRQLGAVPADHASEEASIARRSQCSSAEGRGLVSVVNSVDSILMDGVPDDILQELNVLIISFLRYVRRFIGKEVLQDPSNWKRFLRYSSRTGQEEFYPEYFMEPLRNQLDFQEAMVHTQLFVSFMDRLRREYKQHNHLRLLVADWLYFRWHQRRRRRQHQLMETML